MIYLLWHDNMVAEKESVERARHLAEQAAQMQGAGLRQLRIIFGRMIKGELFVMYALWHQNMQDFKQAELAAMMAAKVAEQMQGTALKQLMGIMMRIMKGEVGYLLTNWKTQQRAYKKALAREKAKRKQSAADSDYNDLLQQLAFQKAWRAAQTAYAIHRALNKSNLPLRCVSEWRSNNTQAKADQARALCSLSIFQHVGHVFWMVVGVVRRVDQQQMKDRRMQFIQDWKFGVFGLNQRKGMAISHGVHNDKDEFVFTSDEDQ